MTLLTGKILGAVIKKRATKTQKQLFDESMTAFEKQLEKKAKEKIKTGKFNKYGNPSK
jgi:hypothetical protein